MSLEEWPAKVKCVGTAAVAGIGVVRIFSYKLSMSFGNTDKKGQILEKMKRYLLLESNTFYSGREAPS